MQLVFLPVSNRGILMPRCQILIYHINQVPFWTHSLGLIVSVSISTLFSWLKLYFKSQAQSLNFDPTLPRQVLQRPVVAFDLWYTWCKSLPMHLTLLRYFYCSVAKASSLWFRHPWILEFYCFIVHLDRLHLVDVSTYCDDVQARKSDFLEAWMPWGQHPPGSRTDAVSEVLPGSLP